MPLNCKVGDQAFINTNISKVTINHNVVSNLYRDHTAHDTGGGNSTTTHAHGTYPTNYDQTVKVLPTSIETLIIPKDVVLNQKYGRDSIHGWYYADTYEKWYYRNLNKLTNLRDVFAYYTQPPVCANLFAGSYTNATLHVPKGCKSYYEALEDWKYFTIVDDIVEGITAETLTLDTTSLMLMVGNLYSLKATVIPNNTSVMPLRWTSSDEKIATVDGNGTVHGVAPGIITITVTTTDGSGLSASCQVTVVTASQPTVVAESYDMAFRNGNVAYGVVNEETLIPLCLNNTGKIKAFSATINLPEKIELVGKLDSSITTADRTAGFTIKAVRNADGTITITGTGSERLKPGDGPVANMRVKTRWQNTYDLDVTSMSVTTEDSTVKKLPDSTTRLVVNGKRGDMNGDGVVDVTDALYIYNMALGSEDTQQSSSTPKHLYVTGTFCNWDWDKAVEMVPVNGAPNVFWHIVYIDNVYGIKFNSAKAWDGNEVGIYGLSSISGDLSSEICPLSGDTNGNIGSSRGGWYLMIVTTSMSGSKVNYDVQFQKPEVWTIGHLLGDGGVWTELTGDTFTVPSTFNGEFVSPAFRATLPGNDDEGSVRFYVKIPTMDWWRSEFVVFPETEAIQYRGDKGEQSRVGCTAGQHLYLNFLNDTGHYGN